MEKEVSEAIQDFKDLLRLSGLAVGNGRFYEIANRYRKDGEPWLLASLALGRGPTELVIGWRKRVVVIDWSASGLDLEVFFRDDVTKGPGFIHAWGYAKALQYLTELDLWLRCTPEALEKYRETYQKQTKEQSCQSS